MMNTKHPLVQDLCHSWPASSFWGQVVAQDATLFQQVEDNELRECFVKPLSTCRQAWFWK